MILEKKNTNLAIKFFNPINFEVDLENPKRVKKNIGYSHGLLGAKPKRRMIRGAFRHVAIKVGLIR